MCLPGGVRSEGRGSSRSRRQGLKEEHERQVCGVTGLVGGLVSGPRDALLSHHRAWLTREQWEASPPSLHFITVRTDVMKSNSVQPPDRSNMENKQGIPWRFSD